MTTEQAPDAKPPTDYSHQPMTDEHGHPKWFDVADGLLALQLPGGILTQTSNGQGRTTFVPGVVLVPSSTAWGRASMAAAPVPAIAINCYGDPEKAST